MVAPLLTVNQSGNPFVEVFVQTVPAGTATMRVERASEDRRWTVRGGVDIPPGVAVLDFEVPFQVPAVYRAECFNGSGSSLGYTEASTITVDESRTFIHQPLVPQMYATVTTLAGTAETITRPNESELVLVEGATLPKVISAGRRGVTEMPYSFLVDSIAEADRVQEMLGTYEVRQLPILVVRTPPPARVPRTFFMHVPALPERWIAPGRESEYFSFDFSATEVEPPFPGLTTPLLTYDDLDAAYSTYTLLDAAFASYSDRDRAYQLAGTA